MACTRIWGISASEIGDFDQQNGDLNDVINKDWNPTSRDTDWTKDNGRGTQLAGEFMERLSAILKPWRGYTH